MGIRFFFMLFLAVVSTQALGEDYSWVDADELKLELTSRRNDLERTLERVTDLEQQLVARQNELQTLREEIASVDARLIQRTSMLYRLSKNGRSVQYLFHSDSVIAFVKRMQTLKKLVTSQMDEKRELSLQLARVDDEMATLTDKRRSAEQLATQLESVVKNLQMELSQRGKPAMVSPY